ncbi:hypothetical protein TNCV_3390661 [Trichonephila clavipes]|nr:hypothetical protein TNCV_3390661 [Trichonephila clavipes]
MFRRFSFGLYGRTAADSRTVKAGRCGMQPKAKAKAVFARRRSRKLKYELKLWNFEEMKKASGETQRCASERCIYAHIIVKLIC